MIKLDIRNSLGETIGARNGLPTRFLEGLLKQAQTHVKTLMASRDEQGYAFLGLPEDGETVKKIEAFAKSNRHWEAVVVLGIGGSALGGIALQDAILGPACNLSGKPKLFFVDNVDPDWVTSILDTLDLEKTLFIVVSKSGGTVEPMALYAVVQERLKTKVKEWKKHWAFVTDPTDGLLRQLGGKEGIPMFPIPSKVGGRFSVLSAAALLPAALAGIDIRELLAGAHAMKEAIKKTQGGSHPAVVLAAIQFGMNVEKGKPMVVMMPYSNRLYRFADWYRQLLAESIGKNPTVGPTPLSALGTTDQHSQLQLWNEGPMDKWILFVTVEKHDREAPIGKNLPKEFGYLAGKDLSDILKAAHQGTSGSLAENGRPNATLSIGKIDEATIGGLFMLFECQVALLGLMHKVNAFDQPGVELGKQITKRILSSRS